MEEPIAGTGNVFVKRGESLEREKYLLTIINLKLISYYWQMMFSDFKNSFPQAIIFSLNLNSCEAIEQFFLKATISQRNEYNSSTVSTKARSEKLWMAWAKAR